MKFSFLIPSKNRLELLAHAVESILRQDYEDFEIVISDNASEQDYAGYVQRIGDQRIVYRRLPAPVPVTDNWNSALELARGDYVLMLGDDDALAPGFLPRVADLIREMAQPDVVYLAAYHYCYPGVIGSAPTGYLADVRNSEFLQGKAAPFRLPPEQAQRVAQAAFDFRYLFGFNSQHFLFRKGFLRDISSSIGSIFQGPYPDTFAATVSFLKARSIVVVPDPLVIIGISPKSFGYYYFNDLATEGADFLDNERLSLDVRDTLNACVLPGDRNNTNWLVAVEEARRALAPSIDLKVGIDRYRMLQIVAFLREIYLKGVRQLDEIPQLIQKLTRSEAAALGALKAVIESSGVDGRNGVIRVFEAIDRGLAQFWPAEVKLLDIGPHSSIRDAFNWLEKSREERRGGTPALPASERPKEMHHSAGQCPYCLGASRYAYSAADWNQHTSKEKFAYRVCSECSLIFMDPAPDNLARYYINEQYDIPADRGAFQPRADSQSWKVDILKNLVAGGRLFEVGPATGEFAFAARKAGFLPKLAEMDAKCCAFLRDILGLDVIQTERPADCLGTGDKYDAICIWQAIEHIPNFWELLSRASDSLSSRGVIVVSTPNPRSLQARILGRYWPHIDAPRHLYLISQDWFRAFALRHNLSIVMNTTRDVGSTDLNYYGWYLAVRNLSHGMLPELRVQAMASRITHAVRDREESEGRGCSYTIAFKKR